MHEPPRPPLDEQSIFDAFPRVAAQIAAVVVASVGLVVSLYAFGSVGRSSDDEAGGPATTAQVAQLPPGPTDTAPAPAPTDPPGTAGSSGTTAEDTGDTAPATADGTTAEGTTEPPAPRIAHLSAPDARDDGVDDCGEPTSYGPIFTVDKTPDTAWMVPGDGVGTVLTIELAEPSLVSTVGLIPGYDKSDPCSGSERFDELRRITEVRWTFGDGTSIDQKLPPTPDLHTEVLDAPVVTERVTMTILATTEPGVDRLDFTPVSEILVD